MQIEIKYDQDKLVLPEVVCSCGMNHVIPDVDIYIGKGVVKNTANYIKKRNFGQNALVVTDNILYDIAGKQVALILESAGFRVTMCKLTREGELHPNESALGEVLLALDKDTDFLVAVGSGSITDVTRYVAVNTNRPFVSVGTAASMDGYTSVVAPLLNGNLKVNKPASYPSVIICDLDILKKAPYDMLVSGFGDVIGKYIAKADWILGKMINDEPYCPACVEILDQAVETCVANIDGIRNRTDKGIKSLIEGLILAGLTILIIGNTRPVASVEHNMSHYWEMMKLARNSESPRHGISVGSATTYAAKFFDEFLQYDIKDIDIEEIENNRLHEGERAKLIKQKYGEQIGESILQENPYELKDWPEHKRRVEVILNNFQEIKQALAFLPSYDEVRAMFDKLEFPISAQDIGIEPDLLNDGLMYAKDYRNRYTVFNAANELGILEELVTKILNKQV